MKKLIWMVLYLAATLFLTVAATGAENAPQGNRNILLNPGFEEYTPGVPPKNSGGDDARIRVSDNISVTPWKPVGDGFSVVNDVRHSGRNSIYIRNTDPQKRFGMRQTVHFDKPTTSALRFGVWSRGKKVGVGGDYNVFIDAYYEDGTPLWGMIAPFPNDSDEWTCAEKIFVPRKPIKEIRLFVFLRKTAGEVWFDDVFLEELDVDVVSFQPVGAPFGSGSCLVSGAFRWLKSGLVPSVRIAPNPSSSDDFNPVEKRVDSQSFSLVADLKNQNGTPAHQAIVSLRTVDEAGRFTVLREEKIELTAQKNRRNFYLWTVPSTQRVFLHTLPKFVSRKNDELPLPVANVELAGNEYESFQLALLAQNELKNIRFTWTDLAKTGSPEHKIGREHIQWQQVGYIRADHIMILPCDKEGVPGWWPDPLLPVSRGRAPAGKSVVFWFTVYAPPGTAPGSYKGTITMTMDDATTIEIPVVAKVRNFTLAQEGHLPNAFALMNGFLEKVYKRTPDTKLRTAYGEFMLRHRLSPEGDISRTDMPVMVELEQYRNRGLGKFNLVNMVRDRGMSTWVCNSPASLYTPEFKKKMYDKIKPVVDELRRRGLAKDAYIYTFDETKKEYEPIVREFFGMVKEHFPEVATFTTAKIPQRVDELNSLNIDWLCPSTRTYNYQDAEKCRAAGKKIWSYVCCGPDHPYANIMCRFPLIESRILGWQSFEQKYDGFLYWGVNIWPSRSNVPIDPENGIFLDWSIEGIIGHEIYGDGRLIYANKNGEPIGSTRLAVLRDGLEDYEYLYLLSKKLGSVDEARQWCPPVFFDPTSFTRDDKVLKTQRSKVADRIEQ